MARRSWQIGGLGCILRFMMSISDLRGRFNVPGVVFKEGKGGLTVVAIENAAASGEIYLLGATVTHFQPKDSEPVIFVSKEAVFQEGKAIRGGIPICWPWFGPKWDDAKAPQHGLVRNKPWNVTTVREVDHSTTEIRLESDVPGLKAALTMTVGATLKVALESKNTGTAPARLDDALHTYFVVGDSKQAAISGLGGVTFVDKMAGSVKKQQSADPIRFTAETDRVYLDTAATCLLTDPVMKRTIRVAKSGSKSTVVWNPWIDKSKALNDFGDDEWTGMCCIETANALENFLTLQPGESHVTTLEIAVARM